MIDLHTHTTASDGRCTPAELVARAKAAGVTVLALTDHDTVSGCDAAGALCAAAGIEFVPGIEITAMSGTNDGSDIHVLGYFVEVASPPLDAFLANQRRQRIDRVRRMLAALSALGVNIDADAILQPAIDDPAKSAGRPWIARALVAGGYAANSDEAFDRWLVRGKPAYVERHGPTPEEAIAKIHEAGGIASLAHPALVRRDDLIGGLVAQGLDALEAYHSEHDETATRRYIAMAAALGIAVSGGSDFHGDPSHGPSQPGAVALPPDEFERLVRRREERRQP